MKKPWMVSLLSIGCLLSSPVTFGATTTPQTANVKSQTPTNHHVKHSVKHHRSQRRSGWPDTYFVVDHAAGMSSKQMKLMGFDTIQCQGNFNVQIISGKTDNDIRVIGTQNLVDSTHIQLLDGRLQITQDARAQMAQQSMSPLLVVIHAKDVNQFSFNGYGDVFANGLHNNPTDVQISSVGNTSLKGHFALRNLAVNGSGNVDIDNIYSPQLSINMQGNKSISIQGMANLKQLTYGGNTRLKMHWVKSLNLKVQGSGNTYVQIAGIANTLNMKLYQRARFDGRYLRVNNSYVKTFDNTVADLNVLHGQNVIAADQSNVFYVNKPEFKSSYMVGQGSVFDAVGLS